MEFVQGTKLSDIWLDLEERQVISLLRQLTRVEDDIDFFPRWRKPVLCTTPEDAGKGVGHPTRGRAFLRRSRCKRYGRKSQLDDDRGPCTPLSAILFSYSILELTGDHRQKR